MLETQLSRRTAGKLAFAALGAASLSLATANPAHAASYHIRTVSDSYRIADAQKLLDAINAYRAANGRGPVKHSARIASVMDGEARRQFIEGAFSHSNTFLTTPVATGYSFAREVIALSYNDDINQLMAFWKSSPAHRDAILAPEANTVGIGLCYGTGSGLPWRVLGNVGIYRFNGAGPGDIQTRVDGGGLSVQSSAASGTTLNHPVVGGISSRFYADGGLDHYGQPNGPEYGGLVGGGYWQSFSKGSDRHTILWSPSTGANAVKETGAIGSHWRSIGVENTVGYPIMNERSGLINGGWWQQFQTVEGHRRTIIWSPNTGAHMVKEGTPFARAWRDSGAEYGFGYPTTDEYWVGLEIRQNFSNGVTLAWNSVTGALRQF